MNGFQNTIRHQGEYEISHLELQNFDFRCWNLAFAEYLKLFWTTEKEQQRESISSDKTDSYIRPLINMLSHKTSKQTFLDS